MRRCYWDLRLFDATKSAAEATNPKIRAVYMDLAAHYVSMSKLCSPSDDTLTLQLSPADLGLSQGQVL